MSSEEVLITSTLDGGWTVALGDTCLAGFYGPKARWMAESHRDLLVAALGRAAAEHGMEQGTPVGYLSAGI
jgi:hypothetical protein